MALAGIHHHSSEAIVASHHRQLLVSHLHVVGAHIHVQLAFHEVEMCSRLIVPRSFGLVGDGVVHVVIVFLCMGHIVASPHGLLTVGVEFGLQDVAEHLYVVASSAIAFAQGGIHVAAL